MGFKEKFENFFPVKIIIRFLKRIKLPGMEGMSVYNLLAIYLYGIMEGKITTRAAAVSWSLFLSLFPFLLFVYSWVPFLPNFEMIEESIYNFLVDRIFPQSDANEIENYVSIISKRSNVGWFTILLTVLFATNGVNSLMTGFTNSAREVSRIKERGIIEQYTVAAFFTVLSTIFLLGFLWFINYAIGPGAVFLNELFDNALLEGVIKKVLLYLSGFVFFTSSIAFLYYYSVEFKARFRRVIPGAIMTTFLFFLLTMGFSFYIENFNNYNLLYGSISTLLLVMLFLYITVIIILLGFELNVAILYARQTHVENRNQSSE